MTHTWPFDWTRSYSCFVGHAVSRTGVIWQNPRWMGSLARCVARLARFFDGDLFVKMQEVAIPDKILSVVQSK